MKENYIILRNFFKKEKCLEMALKLDELLSKGIYRKPDPLCKLSPAFYGIFNDELVQVHKDIELATGDELYPCYSYARIYQEGDSLPPHTDRPSAEISFTLTLNYEKFVWPFFLQNNGQIVQIDLGVGDALLYKGTEVMHFRHPMYGQRFQYQAFFHYVRKQGNYSEYKYDIDKRLVSSAEAEAFNFPDWSSQEVQSESKSTINTIYKDTL